jgi:ABC-type multidrug transport system fused ATPase/permease subunit
MKPKLLPYIIGLIGCSIMEASSPIISAAMVKYVLDAAVKKQMEVIIKASIILSIAILVISMLMPLFYYLFSSSVKCMLAEIKLRAFKHLEEISIDYFENTHSGDTISRITNDVQLIENAYTNNLRTIITLFITAAASAVFMFSLDSKIASVLIVLGVVSTYINASFAKSVKKLNSALQQKVALLTQQLVDILSGFSVIKMFNLNELMLKKYNETNCSKTNLSAALSVRYSFLNSINFLIIWICNGGLFIVGTIMIINGRISLGGLLTMILLFDPVNRLFNQLGNFVVQLQSSLVGVNRIFELLNMPPEKEEYNLAGTYTGSNIIEIQNLSFNYKDRDNVINNLSLSVEKNSKIAFVGLSGGGKSTIIKLLLGFYPIETGNIFINNRSISEYKLMELRNMIAYVPQDAYLFEGTIEENIRYGKLTASHDEIIAAAKVANAHEFILEQPEGYNTMIGERGAKLSGGQKQRISIARALLKDAPILLLDEATSALDTESEELVQEALNNLMRGRTTITIAHRLSTIKNSDAIYVLGNGSIQEKGTHNELLSMSGLYRQLYEVQLTG